jgi:gluconate 2-dehydrogenase gamma chain
MLEQTEQGDLPGEHWTPYSPGQFFRMIRDHTMQGFYGNPRHGGNKDFASYRMIGMSYPQIIGQNRYRWLPDTKVNQLEFK